ncbi:hypothetical protein [Bacillus solimangrovi]|uniref:ABC transporter permease n=1 Tax=Bacillus solimangrovi TaxID=1305675 RepID=A0A1E5LEK2_9BACI|nr:hypothetical protein [Bacillus solimangrovi]OEH92500.1 hypothetical protein BFG57_15705 [Bacillus solimangrovi]
MKSKKSLFNVGIVKQDLRQHGWVSVLYLLGLLFALPLQMLMINEDSFRSTYDNLETYFDIGVTIQIIFIYTLSILAGIFLFRYLQTKDLEVR